MDIDKHSIKVVDGSQVLASTKLSIATIKSCSRLLDAAVDRTRQASGGSETTVPAYGISERTLSFLLRSLESFEQHKTPDAGYMRVSDLADLTTAIWKFGCRPNMFARMATSLLNSRKESGTAIDWAFIAFVFGWRDIFVDATEVLIMGENDKRVWNSDRAKILGREFNFRFARRA
jgi:hypothetical protein